MKVEIFFLKSKVELLQFWKRQRNLCFICCRTLWCLVPAGNHKTISGTTDEMQSNGHVWFMTILELLFFGLHSMDGQLNGFLSASASGCVYRVCVCVVCDVSVCVNACVCAFYGVLAGTVDCFRVPASLLSFIDFLAFAHVAAAGAAMLG